MIEPRCKHNWVTPPECPQCCSDERDQLRQQLESKKKELEFSGTIALKYSVLSSDFVALQQKYEAAQKACAEMHFYAEQAEARLNNASHAAQHDPSWCRPKTMTHDEVKDACIQAYHWVHKIIAADCGKGWGSPGKVKALLEAGNQLAQKCYSLCAGEDEISAWDSAKKDL